MKRRGISRASLFVLLAFALVLAVLMSQVTAQSEMDEEDFDLEDNELDQRDYQDPSHAADQEREDYSNRAEADRRQAQFAARALGEVSLSEQIANVAAMMPLAERMHLRMRVLKLGAFCDHCLIWLAKDVGVKPPADKVALFVIFVASSYLPVLIATIFYNALFKKQIPPRFDASMYAFNKPDAVEINKILKTVANIQESVQKLQENGTGGAASSSPASQEQERLLAQTQHQLQDLGQSIQEMQMLQQIQSKKLDEMDKQLRNNFSVMFDAICKKIDAASLQPAYDDNSPAQSPAQKALPTKKANQSSAAGNASSTQNQKNVQAASAGSQKAAPKSVPSGTKDQAKAGEEEDEEYYEYYEEDEDEV